MPQQKQLTWAQLRVGVLVIVSLTVFAVAIFFISGQVGFLTRRYTLKAYFSDAGGLREGAEVQLAGIAVGNVNRIRISPHPEAGRAVEVLMRITRTYQGQIRADSAATLETTGLLGDRHVDITLGGPGQSPLPDGGVLKSREEPDIKKIVQNTNDVISNLRVLSAKLNEVAAQIQSSRGSLGKLIYDQSFYNRLNETAGGVQRLVAQVEKGQGTLGKFLSDETLYQRTSATIDRLSQVAEEIQHGNGSLAKFISDPSIYDHVNQAVAQANALIENVNKGQGTLGKLATDPQLYNRINDTFDRVNVISTRIEEGQGTLGKLSTDPALYNNLSQSSQALREFLTEFKKNPKKYLSVRVRLF
jgi:phospholipid/cholesterol/gamma-HCH transport system substrate-binding protein